MRALTFLELTVTAAACVPAARLLSRPSTRRVAPRLFLALLSAVAVFASAMLYLGILYPQWLHLPTLLTALVAMATWWRARPGAGAARGLPPGSMSLLDSLRAIVDRRFYYRRFERHGQIFKMAQFHHRAICVLGLDLGHRLLREHAVELGPTDLAFNREIEGGFLRYMDAETHKKYGNLFRAAFSPALVEASAASIGATLGREVESRFAASGVTTLSQAELDAFCRRLSSCAMLRLAFDLEPGSPNFERYSEAQTVFARQAADRPLTAATTAALGVLRAVVSEQAEVARGRLESGSSPSRCALEEMLRLDPEQPDKTTIDNLIFVSKIASGNVGAYLVWQLVQLGRHPEWIDRLRVEHRGHESPGVPDLTLRVVKETLRLEQSEFLYRRILSDFTDNGYLFPKGWLLRLCVRESHRLPEVFEHPDRFDPDRFARRDFGSSEYSPFGFMRHACLGAPTTFMIGGWVIRHLVAGHDWRVTRDGHPVRELRHWKHWRPSPETVVEFRSVATAPGS